MTTYAQPNTKVNSEVNQLSGTRLSDFQDRLRREYLEGLTDEQREAFDAIPDSAEYKANRKERRWRLKRDRSKTLNWISGAVPPWLRHMFRGVGVLSVANYILAQIKRTGVCDVFYEAMAKATGTCRKTVQRAVALLRKAGLSVRYGDYNRLTGKNEATVIKTTCRKLRSWIARNVGGGGQQSPSTSNIERFFVRPAKNKAHKEAPNGNSLPP